MCTPWHATTPNRLLTLQWLYLGSLPAHPTYVGSCGEAGGPASLSLAPLRATLVLVLGTYWLSPYSVPQDSYSDSLGSPGTVQVGQVLRRTAVMQANVLSSVINFVYSDKHTCCHNTGHKVNCIIQIHNLRAALLMKEPKSNGETPPYIHRVCYHWLTVNISAIR